MARLTKQEQEQLYNKQVAGYKWLKLMDTTQHKTATIPEDLQMRVRHLNTREHVRHQDVILLKSGRDTVSRFSAHDLRRFIPKSSYELVYRLYDIDRDRLYMLKWLTRGLDMYPAYCRTLANKLYNESK